MKKWDPVAERVSWLSRIAGRQLPPSAGRWGESYPLARGPESWLKEHTKAMKFLFGNICARSPCYRNQKKY